VRGFRAFGLLLEEHPEWRGRVSMLALLDPSRQSIPVYADYLAAIRRVTAEVNERFGGEEWRPVELRVADDFLQSVAAYKQYDVLLVNAVFDGLNLVSKEAPLLNGRDGVLILSENTGAHEELSDWALTVNPFDVYGQAQAINEALTMPQEERRQRLESIRAHVRENDLAAWIAAQLADLDRVSARVSA
jgi:trehalose 6-phosphate synthase